MFLRSGRCNIYIIKEGNAIVIYVEGPKNVWEGKLHRGRKNSMGTIFDLDISEVLLGYSVVDRGSAC